MNGARQRSVPSGRISRLSGFGRLAGGVAGGMLAEGARRLAKGEIPKVEDMLLTPGNAMRLADRLAHLRGAAMKLGQMISMDAGDMLPPELATILASLRDRANFMPARQLDGVLKEQWGNDWRGQFKWFNPRPIAAASIGQVHKAMTRDGQLLAIKVQYPGVADSVDSDVDNVATLLRISGVLPEELDISGLLEAAKVQLKEEADYVREGQQMQLYTAKLAGDDGFVIPTLHEGLTREHILAMSFEEGVPIDSLESEPQEQRDAVAQRMMRLVARELFELGVMQTDPNFANFHYRPATGQIVLLDFGAARDVSPSITEGYRALIKAGLAGDAEDIKLAAKSAGFVNQAALDRHPERIGKMIDIIVGEMSQDAPFDFGDRSFVPLLRDEGMAIAEDKKSWHLPPPDSIFIQRKVSGTALLGARLKARVNIRRILEEVL